MSAEASEMKSSEQEIDKRRRRHRLDDTVIATAAMSGCEDTFQYPKMDNVEESAGKPTDLCLQNSFHLISSTTSSLADTPGDSGVLCLDSEASEATSQALMTHSMVGAEELACDSLYDAPPSCSHDMIKSTTSSLMARSDFDNQHLGATDDIVPEHVEAHKKSPIFENLPDVVLKALQTTHSAEEIRKPALQSTEPKKSLSEDIVYRRRCKKKSQSSSQKKRVSFHEDILNNTKTDNIHIERGFISYGSDRAYCDRFKQKDNLTSDRFSWCASGDKPKYVPEVGQQTMSDILTYGDNKNDRSGIFEYKDYPDPENGNGDTKDKANNNDQRRKGKLYGCDSNSSDSNFSCDSESSSTDSSSSNCNKMDNSPLHRKDKAQKSYSCDAFDNSHVSFMRKTYFSEADIDKSHDRMNKPLEVTQSPKTVKSVLKKNRYVPTNVVEERKQSTMLNLLDAKNIIGSLKSFYKNFNFNFAPEKGVPENSVDLNNVVEALSDVNQNPSKKLSKSLDSGFQIDDDDDFVEINLNGQPLDTEVTKEPTPSKSTTEKTNEGSPRHKLTLNMKTQHDKKSTNQALQPVDKYVVNCESTVYEHKGVSYSYIHDTFQTAFDAPKETFVPIPESTPNKEMVTSATKSELSSKLSDVDTSSKASTPRRQFSKLQDEDLKSGIPKHLSSPKKQNINRYSRKSTSSLLKLNEDVQGSSDNCSNTDNSTVKGVEDFLDEFFDSPSNHKLQSNKSALLNRYLKSVYQRKDLELKIRSNKFFRFKLMLEKDFPSIIFPFKDVSKTFRDSAQRMSRLVDKEVIENKRLSVRLLTADEPSYFDSFEDNVAMECNEKLKLQIFSYPKETLNRMMRVQSPYNMEDGSWTPQLVFITDYALYVASVRPGATEYEILCRLPHDELDAIAGTLLSRGPMPPRGPLPPLGNIATLKPPATLGAFSTPGPPATSGHIAIPRPPATLGATSTPAPITNPGPIGSPGPIATSGPSSTLGHFAFLGPPATLGPIATPGPISTPGPPANPGHIATSGSPGTLGPLCHPRSMYPGRLLPFPVSILGPKGPKMLTHIIIPFITLTKVGPEAQYIQVVDIAGNIACSVVTGDSSLGARFASSLEWSARTSPLRIARPPAMLPLSTKPLAVAIARQKHEKKTPQILFYGRACSGDAGERLIEASGAFAPPLEGYLMCRTDKSKRFEPCYFLLRAGVLQWGAHPDGSPLPHSIALKLAVGVRRHMDWSRRPHCFEIALQDGSRLLLAAPDDPTASSWLQSLLLHAAQALEEKDCVKKSDPRVCGPPPACTVIVTTTEVISLRDTLDMAFVQGAAAYLKHRGSEALLKEYIAEMRTDVEILACGSIKDLTAFKIPDTDENWCCLEWSVCEARERGAGLALVLSSGGQLERLIAAVECAHARLTSEPFPLSVVEANKSACSAAHSKYDAAWAHMLPQQ